MGSLQAPDSGHIRQLVRFFLPYIGPLVAVDNIFDRLETAYFGWQGLQDKSFARWFGVLMPDKVVETTHRHPFFERPRALQQDAAPALLFLKCAFECGNIADA